MLVVHLVRVGVLSKVSKFGRFKHDTSKPFGHLTRLLVPLDRLPDQLLAVVPSLVVPWLLMLKPIRVD